METILATISQIILATAFVLIGSGLWLTSTAIVRMLSKPTTRKNRTVRFRKKDLK